MLTFPKTGMLRVGPVPAKGPLLTGSGRFDLNGLQGRDEERAFQSEQGTWVRKQGRQESGQAGRARPGGKRLKGHSGECLGIGCALFHTEQPGGNRLFFDMKSLDT
jgi:hypothetical protein